MKRGKNKDLLIEEIKLFIPHLLVDEKLLDETSTHLFDHYNIPKGDLLYAINKSRRLEYKEVEFLAVLAEQLSIKIPQAEETLTLKEWFTESEIKELRKYSYESVNVNDDEVIFPLVIPNVIYLGDGVYNASIDKELIARLYKHNNLNYNFDIQRDAIIVERGGELIKTINLNNKNIAEMKSLIIKNKLMTTALAYNCAVDTADDGLDEIEYNPDTQELTINKGTNIDIVDGTHRTIAFHSVYLEKGKDALKGKIPVLITNYTTDKAKEYQAQLAKATPISQARQLALAEKDYSVTLVNRLNSEGMLKDRIASTSNSLKSDSISKALFSDLVSGFNLLWKPETKLEVGRVFKFIDGYLEYLFDYIHRNKEKDIYLLTEKRLFISQIMIAKYMHDNGINLEDFEEIIEKIDWSSNNKKLKELRDKMVNKSFNNRSISDVNEYLLNEIKS